MNMPTSIPTIKETEQAVFERLAEQSRLPGGDFAAMLPYGALRPLFMDFGELRARALDTAVLVLMNNRAELAEHYAHDAAVVAECHGGLDNCLNHMEALLTLGREASRRMDDLYRSLNGR